MVDRVRRSIAVSCDYPLPDCRLTIRARPVGSLELSVQIRILLADDSNVMRHAISRLLLEDSGFALVGEASGLHEALEKSRSLQPDVVIMDLHMARWADGDAEISIDIC